MSRLSILTKEEFHSLYSIPKLDDEERSFLFTLDDDDKIYLKTLENDIPRKVNYILQLGYYRAVNYFFRFSFQKRQIDVEFILKRYFHGEPFPKKHISKNYHYTNRAAVMKKYGLNDCDCYFEDQLFVEAKILAKRHILPKFILQELLSYCLQKNVIRPGYSKIQDIISKALNHERNRLINKFYTVADKELRNQLDKLLENDNLFYHLTLLKKDQKNFTTTEIKNSVTKQQMIIGIYRKSLPLIQKLSISEQNIIYYANLAEFYTVPRIKRLKNKNLSRLYLFCYVHRRFLKINNHLVKYNKKGKLVKWVLPYTRIDDGIDNPFYEQLSVCGIGEVIRFVADATGFLKSFSHLQQKYVKSIPEPEAVHACIITNATGIETKKMKEISDVKENDLNNVNKNFIRCETLCSASDVIINKTAKLPIFNEYNLSDYGVHASVDGQKFATKYNTIKSRYSKKYFGMMKGVVFYTLNANHLPLCLKVIGANEHESHFLLDIVESNTSDIEIKAVSGDMHSINRVNFALMYLFGYRFMPRFTKLGVKTENNLVCFGNISDYDKFIIKPSKKVDNLHIIKEWDNVLRIMASLALKKTTQSQIVRKLSSFKMNPTLKAIISLDEIIMSDYMLDLIDSKEIRMIVQSSLCRGESYNQLSATIAKVSGGRMLSGKNEIELDINAESIRLITNAVIFYNATILSKLYEHFLSIDSVKARIIARLSPVAWRHINFIGKYEFYNQRNPINIQWVISFFLENSKIDIPAVVQ